VRGGSGGIEQRIAGPGIIDVVDPRYGCLNRCAVWVSVSNGSSSSRPPRIEPLFAHAATVLQTTTLIDGQDRASPQLRAMSGLSAALCSWARPMSLAVSLISSVSTRAASAPAARGYILLT
jgi:hypothetical protein